MTLGADRDWPVYLGDPAGSHYSTLDQINRANVARLEVAWTYRAGEVAPDQRTQIQCNPLVIGGVLFGTSARLSLFALDGATGRELWRFDPFPPGATLPAGGVNRGLAWWSQGGERRLLFAVGPHLYAIDPDTGLPVPAFGEQGRVDLRQGLDRDITGLNLVSNTPGAVYGDLLIVTTRVSEGPDPAAPGHIRAYDVRTGERRWIFHTIPHPGEYGHETWPPDAWRNSGGANCWAGVTIDHTLGLVFVPTGSAAYDFWGGDRVGDNLFANCLLALDAATGRRRWHFQLVKHDVWDRDLVAPPVLCELSRAGRRILAVAQTTKDGHVWVFDRKTGEPLFPLREVPVPPSHLAGEALPATQLLPVKPAPFARQAFTEDEVTDLSPEAKAAVLERLRGVTPHQPFSPPSERGTVIFPGYGGGAEWGGPAVDPGGILYVNSTEMPCIQYMVPAQGRPGAGEGRLLYRQFCMACHGENREGGVGHGVIVPSLQELAPRMSRANFVDLLVRGRGTMPAFAFLNAAQRGRLADHLLGSPGAADIGPLSLAPRVPWVSTGYRRFLDPEGWPAVKPPWGTLSAIDLNTGEYRWQVRLGEHAALSARGIPPTGTENCGGPVVTAGGVLFIAATSDGKMRAFDTATGEKLWEAHLPAGGYATPTTYSVGDRQYVVIACGGGKFGTPSDDSYVAFALPPETDH